MVFYWATGTWWIPMIAILAVWRYVFRRQPLTYDPLYWGAVFPLGMYAVGTFEMERAMGFDFLDPIPHIFFAIALAAWLARRSASPAAFVAAPSRGPVDGGPVDGGFAIRRGVRSRGPDGALLRRRASQGR